jgi:hypothetical protein
MPCVEAHNSHATKRTPKEILGDSSNLIEAASLYCDWGYPIAPVLKQGDTHRVAVELDKNIPTERDVREWFSNYQVAGLAMALGKTARTPLYCRTFDNPNACLAWAKQAGQWPHLLPIAGCEPRFYVYFRTWLKLSPQKFSDGELRGAGRHCLLPPSLHPSGGSYVWMNDLYPADWYDNMSWANIEESGLLNGVFAIETLL